MVYKALKYWFAIAVLLACSVAAAQSEPTLNQIYETANSGKVEQAQVMMQQVLVAHPNSAKAHFVAAELSARQGKFSRAREDLATAEKLAPGLPFAKPEAVQSLRTQLAAKPGVATATSDARKKTPDLGLSAPASPASSFPWGIALALGGAAVALVVFLTRKKASAPVPSQPYPQRGSVSESGLSGPQTFGAATGAGPAYGQPPYGQPSGSGIGGRMMGGLATGLAVGAGVVAAEAIGKNLMGRNERPEHLADASTGASPANNDFQPLPGNSDLGGQNFGVSDAGSWDDGGSDLASGDAGGDMGGDWDT